MSKGKELKRKHRLCIKLNDKELDLVNKYCKKYKIENRSQLIRESLMRYIIDQMVEQDYPKLFSEQNNSGDNENTTDDTTTATNKDDTDIEYPKLF